MLTGVVQIVQLKPGDEDRYRSIRLRVLRDSPSAFSSTVTEEAKRPPVHWVARLANPTGAVFVAVGGGQDVGLIAVRAHHEFDQDAGISSVWVAPEFRSQNVGSALMESAIEWASVHGYGEVRLDVGRENLPAQRLYARMGFERTGRVSRMPPPRDHITEYEMIASLDRQ